MALHRIEESFIRSHLKYTDLIPVIEDCMATVSRYVEGEIEQPLRTVINAKKSNGWYFIMPVYSSRDNLSTTKIVTVYPDNRGKGLPSHQSMMWVYDGTTGVLKAMIDAALITRMRTAAASAVATKYLAPKNSKIHAILGAGGQAGSHLEALAHICNFDEVRIWNHNFPKGEALAKKYGVKACRTAEEAVRGADVITTVTLSSTPVLFKEWVKQGAHINAVGAPVPSRQEIEPALMRDAVVYVDTREGALSESGDIIISQAPIFGEIGEIVMGKVEAKQEKTTIFKSLGMGMQDLVTAKMLCEMYENMQSSL